VWGTPFHAALGVLVNDPDVFYIGPNPKAFGAAGAGGSLALADRARALVDAAYGVL
jgi:hypothetical protein